MKQTTKAGKKYKKSLLGGKNKLTDKVIEKLTSYYGTAIRGNTGKTVKAMKEDVLATFYPCSCTDTEPQHSYCPKDTSSWCFDNRAIAKKEPIPSHDKMKVSFKLDMKRSWYLKYMKTFFRRPPEQVNQGPHSKSK